MKQNTYKNCLRAFLLGITAAVVAMPMYADKDDETSDVRVTKTKYHFKQPTTPDGLFDYQCGIYTFAGNQIYTANGNEMAKFGEDVVDVKFNPSGYNYFVISQDKKGKPGNRAAMFDPRESNDLTHKFKSSMGNPLSATFSPDGRKLHVATPKRIFVLDPVKFHPLDTISCIIDPTQMVFSPNGNLLAITDGSRVTVLNYETKKPRYDRRQEGNVAQIGFNDDNSEFAILTDDGAIQIYDARTFTIKNTYDDFDGGIGFQYNFDGKYLIIATSPNTIEVINLLDPNDRETINVEAGNINDMMIVPDVRCTPMLCYTTENAVEVDRMSRLSPYYGRLIADEANERLNDWLKMMPGESMEQYRMRVNDESRRNQLRKYEDEIATRYADNLLSMSTITLGNYDRTNQSLKVDFSNMPSILLPVPESDLQAFSDVENLEFRNAVYGITGDDHFELIYAEVYNKADGKSYIFDNLERVPLNFMEGDENVVSIEVIQQQQMEEMRLQEVKQQIIAEAKKENLISDHTHITVDSRVDSDYDADGNRILNYKVKFSYEVEPAFTLREDFGPGKYLVNESGAASAMLKIVKQSFENDLAQYLKEGKKLIVTLTGSADATPILHALPYNGCYGDFVGEPVRQNGQLTNITVTSGTGIRQNEELALVRAAGVRDFIEHNIDNMSNMNTDYNYNIEVSQDKGSEYRRITAEFLFIDAF